MQTLLFGLKGVCAYTDHAAILDENPELYKRIHEGLAAGYDGKERGLNDWVKTVLDCGHSSIMAMELLDAGNTGVYGHPEPTEVPLGPTPAKRFSLPAMTSKTCMTFWSRPKARASIFTPTARCCRPMHIRG